MGTNDRHYASFGYEFQVGELVTFTHLCHPMIVNEIIGSITNLDGYPSARYIVRSNNELIAALPHELKKYEEPPKLQLEPTNQEEKPNDAVI